MRSEILIAPLARALRFPARPWERRSNDCEPRVYRHHENAHVVAQNHEFFENAGKSATTMFVRFRQSRNRLQVSLIETRRVQGKVRHEHIASLGSVDVPASVRGRLLFWSKVPDRLSRLANRIVSEEQMKIYNALHARIPMVTPDEQRALQIENAEADEKLWTILEDQFSVMSESQQVMAEGAKKASGIAKEAAQNARADVEKARGRLAKLRAGEAIEAGLFDNPMTNKDTLKVIGWTKRDLHHALRLGVIEDAGELDKFIAEVLRRQRGTEKAVSREMARKLLESARRRDSTAAP
ncbi:MAG: hypothetical protein WAN43_05485 [Rhodomicrobium sp.]